MRLLGKGSFQPTIASAFGLGRGWGAIWPFLLAAGAGVLLAVYATARVRLTTAALGVGALALVAWALFAALAPTLLGIDHQGLLSIVKAGDHTALDLSLHDGTRFPLRTLVLIAAGARPRCALRCARRWRATAPTELARRPTLPVSSSPSLTLHFEPCSCRQTTT